MEWVRVFANAVADKIAAPRLNLFAQPICSLPGVGLDLHSFGRQPRNTDHGGLHCTVAGPHEDMNRLTIVYLGGLGMAIISSLIA